MGYKHKWRWSWCDEISSQVNLQFISAEPGKKSDLIDLEILKLGEKSLEQYEVNLYSLKDSML